MADFSSEGTVPVLTDRVARDVAHNTRQSKSLLNHQESAIPLRPEEKKFKACDAEVYDELMLPLKWATA